MNTPNPTSGTGRPGGTGRPVYDRAKLTAFLVSLVTVGAVMWPIQENWKRTPHDDFPITYYPMFSAKRDAVETFYYIVGRDKHGARYLVPYSLIGSGGLNQVRKQLNSSVRDGHAARAGRAVAAKLAAESDPPWSQIVTVEVCRGNYSVDDWFHGKKSPVLEQIKATIPVERKTL